VQEKNLQDKNIDGHISDLKTMMMHIVLIFASAFAISWYKVIYIMQFVLYSILPRGYTLHYFTMESMFFTDIRLAFFASLIATFPFILWRVAIYLRCLSINASVVSISVLSLISGGLFAVGIYCGVYYIVPKFVLFMLNMAHSSLDVKLNVSSFVNTVMTLTLIVGFVFQIPVLFFMLIKNNILTVNLMERSRKFYIILSFVLGAILTPPDVFSQIVVSLFFIAVFEISLIVARIFKKN
jgi:sec-independent protein translocase protein TatC